MITHLLAFGAGCLTKLKFQNRVNQTIEDSVPLNPSVDSPESLSEILGENEALDRLVRLNTFDHGLSTRVQYGGVLDCFFNAFCCDDLKIRLTQDLRPIVTSITDVTVNLLGGSSITCLLSDRVNLKELISGVETTFQTYDVADSPTWPDRVEQSMGSGTLQGNLIIRGPYTSALLCMLQMKGTRRPNLTYPVSTSVVYVRNGAISGPPSKYYKEISSEFDYVLDDRRGYDV